MKNGFNPLSIINVLLALNGLGFVLAGQPAAGYWIILPVSFFQIALLMKAGTFPQPQALALILAIAVLGLGLSPWGSLLSCAAILVICGAVASRMLFLSQIGYTGIIWMEPTAILLSWLLYLGFTTSDRPGWLAALA